MQWSADNIPASSLASESALLVFAVTLIPKFHYEGDHVECRRPKPFLLLFLWWSVRIIAFANGFPALGWRFSDVITR